MGRNYMPISDLSSFLKIYDKFIQEPINPLADKFLSEFISKYRGAQYKSLLEQWKRALDSKTSVGAGCADGSFQNI